MSRTGLTLAETIQSLATISERLRETTGDLNGRMTAEFCHDLAQKLDTMLSAARAMDRAREAWRVRSKAGTEIRRIARYKNKTAGMRDDSDRWSRLRDQAETDLGEIFRGAPTP